MKMMEQQIPALTELILQLILLLDGARIFVGDMDGDGDLDIISAGHQDQGKDKWLKNDGAANPSFSC